MCVKIIVRQSSDIFGDTMYIGVLGFLVGSDVVRILPGCFDEKWCYRAAKNLSDMFSSFNFAAECDGQTDGRTDKITIAFTACIQCAVQ